MDAQMQQVMNELNTQITELEKQIAEAKKNKEDPETIKGLEEQLAMLKKQVDMMGGLKKNVSKISGKTFEEANEETPLVPKKDFIRINSLPKKVLSEAELFLFIKNVHAGVEKLIPATERIEALNIYNETKAEYKSVAIVANAASGCWTLGHWEKALFIMGKACIEDITDADNLNNYAAFLIMTGGEQTAIPILEYLNSKYPENSTIKNNLGQAWFGLGDVENAKRNLEEAAGIYNIHSTANSTLASIYQAEGDNTKAINSLKASIKETYDPDKEAQLENLGVKLKYVDLPEFNYPMQQDPLGFISLVNSLPEEYPSRIGDKDNVKKINRYVNGVNKLKDELLGEMEDLKFKIIDHDNKLAKDLSYQREFLESYNCPAYKLARRSVELITQERIGGFSPLISQMLLPGLKPTTDLNNNNNIITDGEILNKCLEIWENEVLKPIADLAYAMRASVDPATASCAQIDAATNAFMAKESQIKKAGTAKIKRIVGKNSLAINQWTKLVLYSTADNPPKKDDKNSWDLISYMDLTIRRKKYKDGVAHNFLNNAARIVEAQTEKKSSCEAPQKQETELGLDELAPLISRNVKCDFKKDISLPIVIYSLECNVIKERAKKNLKKKNDPVPKGNGQSSSRRSQTKAPLGSPRGPNNSFYDENEPGKFTYTPGPLAAEFKDPSQFSIEYDRWGNLIGLILQLNEDGTGLKDPESTESKIDSRWSWNAIASPKKGFLNKLLIKQL